jgi:hypothetical protein
MFWNKKTKWIVLGTYSHVSEDYVVFVRGSLKTGLLDFKTKKVHRNTVFTNRILPTNIVDTKTQWDKIISDINPVNL